MKKLISKLSFSLVAGSSLLAFSGVAAQGCNPCNNLWDWCTFDGCWELGAAAIYQQPCVSHFTFAERTVTVPPGTPVTHRSLDVKPKFYWGFKIWGAWYSCDGCDFANLTWKHLWSYKNRRTVNGPLNIIELVTVIATRAQAIQKTQYDTVYLRAGRNLHCGCDSRFYAFGGLRYVGAELRREVKARFDADDIPPGKVRERTKFQGGGFELGVGGEYGLGCGVNLVGQFATLALLGSRSDTAAVLVTTPNVRNPTSNFPARNITKCVPGIDFRVGINYTYDWCACGCNLRIVGELGWEMDYYWNMLATRIHTVRDFLPSDPIPTNFGTNGPYASLALRF